MANNDHRLNLEESSRYRVAYDLMNRIADLEGKWNTRDEGSRKYLMDLYHQCYLVVYNGYDADQAMGEKEPALPIAI